ncbi:MAG: ATP-dependent sacrificial sulfur transferase LarE [Candidatus Omnitrophica bacterium]|nr:ATP-dependent sacrificial sulfur transferase LarE [Candidatus Omnitrophota bacterium]
MNKLDKLKSILQTMDSVLIAFSGGLDSTFLLKAATLSLSKSKILAVTADSATYPREELRLAKEIADSLGVKHKIIKTNELESSKFVSNPVNRCYFCKKELFIKLKAIAKKSKLNFVADASNASDKLDFRPGNAAKKELKIRSPLQEAGFTKEDIRKFSRKLKLVTWDKPSLACLASRIPYGVKITPKALNKIDNAELEIKKLGFRQVRVRHYNDLCRIEVEKNQLSRLLDKRNLLVDKLKKLGYNYITVDLEGYRTGSLNEAFLKK